MAKRTLLTSLLRGAALALSMYAITSESFLKSAQAEDTAFQEAIEKVTAALNRGYGQTCTLDMQPAGDKGDLSCADFGPYRLVLGYPRRTVYVVTKDGLFKIFEDSTSVYRTRAAVEIDGPWKKDLPEKAAEFLQSSSGGEWGLRKSAEETVRQQMTPGSTKQDHN